MWDGITLFIVMILILNISPSMLQIQPEDLTENTDTTISANTLLITKQNNAETNDDQKTSNNLNINDTIQQIDVKDQKFKVTSEIDEISTSDFSNNSSPNMNSDTLEAQNSPANKRDGENSALNSSTDNTKVTENITTNDNSPDIKETPLSFRSLLPKKYSENSAKSQKTTTHNKNPSIDNFINKLIFNNEEKNNNDDDEKINSTDSILAYNTTTKNGFRISFFPIMNKVIKDNVDKINIDGIMPFKLFSKLIDRTVNNADVLKHISTLYN